MKTKVNGIFTLLLAFVVHLTFAQEKTISGTVTDQDGLPLPGVNIVVVGTTNGTQTDFDGNYTIKSSVGQTILFTYVGQKDAKKVVGAGSTINVQMIEDAQALDEVVVTGLGISRKDKTLGYNVQTVDAEAISVKPNADLVNSLSGTTSGVQIVSSSGEAGASTFITIRGNASITGNNQPLFVVNGMPIATGGGDSGTGGVNTSNRSIDINPDDIASLSVLKGGAATALYGVRAANGAIIITTKSGKNLSSKKIEFHTSVGVDVVSQLPARQKIYAQGNSPSAWAGGSANSWGPEIASLEYDGDTTYKWDPKGRLVPQGTGNGTPAQYYDPYDFFQHGTNINNRLSISNGNESGDYFFSMSNLEQNGIIPNNIYGRTTVRLNGNTKISNAITFGADLAYTNSRAVQIQKGSNVSGIMLGLLRTASTFDNSAGYEFPDGTQRNYRNGGGYDNPYWTANNIAYEEDVNRFTGNINLNVKFTTDLTLTYNTGIDWYSTTYEDKFKIGSRGNPTGYLGVYSSFNSIFNSDLLLNYSKDISDSFDLSLTLGNNFYASNFKRLFGDATGLSIPDYYNLNNTSTNTTSTNNNRFRTSAVFADLQLGFGDMLFLGFTGRNDWSSTMPSQNKSAFYPSASLGFVFSEIEGMKGNFLSFGKLRASAARTANIATPYNTSNYFFAATTADGWTNGVNFPYQGQTGFAVGAGLGNSDLKHETQDTWEVGADLRFFQSRLGLDVTYFNNTNTDLLMAVPIAPSSGFTSVYLNAASKESKGIEISLNANPIKTDNFSWDFVANFTKFSDIVTGLADGVDNIFLGGFTTPQVRAVVGEQYRSIFGEDWYRDASGNVIINDDPTDSFRDGYPMTNTAQGLVPIGNFNPDWTANITNTLAYKNLSLSFLIDVKSGGVMYNGTAFAMNFFGVSERTVNREVYYNTDGTIDFDRTPAKNLVVLDGVYGSLDADGNVVSSGVKNVSPVVLDQAWFQGQGSNFGGGPSSAAMEPADWVRLRDLTFAYNLPEIGKYIKGGQIYFSGRNLWLSTPYSGIDPETNLGGATNAQGMDYFNSPGTKSYTMGVKLTF